MKRQVVVAFSFVGLLCAAVAGDVGISANATLKDGSVVKGEFLRRPNRFIAEVKINGDIHTVHVKNTGRCKELLIDYVNKTEIIVDSQKKNDMVKKIPLKDVIHFMGISNSLEKDIADSAMFVLPSDYEGMPNVLIEAMAMGVPCVSVDCAPGGAAELIEDGVNGYLVPIGNQDVLCKKLSQLIDNPEIANSFSEKSIEIKKHLNSCVVSGRWMDYLSTKTMKRKSNVRM